MIMATPRPHAVLPTTNCRGILPKNKTSRARPRCSRLKMPMFFEKSESLKVSTLRNRNMFYELLVMSLSTW